jgi:hypothetical protein
MCSLIGRSIVGPGASTGAVSGKLQGGREIFAACGRLVRVLEQKKNILTLAVGLSPVDKAVSAGFREPIARRPE